MDINSVITLANDVDVLLLDKVMHENEKYFLAVALNEDKEPTDEYAILKEILEGDKTFVEKLEDPNFLAKLLDLFTYSLKDKVSLLPEEI